MKKLTDFLKEPLSDGRLHPIPSIAVLIGSIFVNAYFLRTSFSGIASWFLKISNGALKAEAQQKIAEAVSLSDGAMISKIAFGLLMTVFVMIFLLPAAYLDSEGQEKKPKFLLERACSTLLAPMLFLLVSALLMKLSFTAGIVFAILAVADCAAVIVKACRKAKLNGYFIIAMTAAFILITLVLCTRNHFITMLG